jgi:hypothetical protein
MMNATRLGIPTAAPTTAPTTAQASARHAQHRTACWCGQDLEHVRSGSCPRCGRGPAVLSLPSV